MATESLDRVVQAAKELLRAVDPNVPPVCLNGIATICARAAHVGKMRERVRLGVPIPPNEVPDAEPVAAKPAELLPYTWNEQRQMYFMLAPVGRMSSADGKVWQIHEVKDGVELPVAPVKEKPPELKNEGVKASGLCCKGGAKEWGKCRGCHGGF